MPTSAVDRDGESGHPDHCGTFAYPDITAGNILPNVNAHGRVDRGVLECASGAHGHRASTAFLCWLEEHLHGAIELASAVHQYLGRAQKHGDMRVVPARVHETVVARAVRNVVFLMDGKRVHIGAQPDGRPRTLTVDDAHHATAPDALMHLVHAEFQQPRGHEGGGFLTLEAQFGMPMQMPPPTWRVPRPSRRKRP